MRHKQFARDQISRTMGKGTIGLLATLGLSLFGPPDTARPEDSAAPTDISPYVAKLAEYGNVAQLTELSNRRRLTTMFVNEQSPFYGVQINYVNVHRGNLTFLIRDLVRQGQLPIVMGRVYDSEYAGGDFGPGWKLSVLETLELREGRWEYLDAAGSRYPLVLREERLSSLHPHLTGVLGGRLNELGAEVRSGEHLKTFERAGGKYRLTSVRDSAGNTLYRMDASFRPAMRCIVPSCKFHTVTALQNMVG